jgi:UDP-2,3-diacylglucosamine pyrophosphatase LpxH
VKYIIFVVLFLLTLNVMAQDSIKIKMDMKAYKYKTIVISDVHLGLKDSKSEDAVNFLKDNNCVNLFLNGDIIDGWQLGRGGKWTKEDSKFIKKILKLVTQDTTKVTYLRGNHDDFLESMIPFYVGDNFQIQTDCIYESCGKKYIILHGDIFDPITSKVGWLAKLGSVGYDVLLYLNRHHNRRRLEKGLPYQSISQDVKKKVKFVVNLLSRFEDAAVDFAKQRHCDGVICGHIHTPEDKTIDGIRYLNSGDWVETKSALVEDFHGNWKIIYY